MFILLKKKITFRRPAALCNSGTELFDVAKHAMENVKQKYDVVVILFPNAPFRTFKDIDNAIDLLIRGNFETVISVEEKKGFYWIKNKEKYLPVTHLENKSEKYNTPLYRAAGGIVICWAKVFKYKDFFESGIGLHIMKEHNARIITTLYDLLVAEKIVKLHSNLIEELLNSR